MEQLTAYFIAHRNTGTFPDTSLILSIVHKEKKKAIERLKKFTEESNEDHAWIAIRPNESAKAKHMKSPRE